MICSGVKMKIFCLDIGGTGTRGTLFAPDGTIIGHAKSDGGALSLGVERSEAAIRDVWTTICGECALSTATANETKLVAGIAGISLPGRGAALAATLNDFASTQFVSDGYGALLAATGGQPGVMISIGTGVTAMRLDGDGNCLSISGWGFPAGDLGSGAWLGLQLLGLLMKVYDGIHMDPCISPDLADDIIAVTGSKQAEIVAWQSGAKPQAYGALAPIIVKYAQAGDRLCIQLLEQAAAEIVGLARTLCHGELDSIQLSGGLGGIRLPYCAALNPSLHWHAEKIDPIEGILLLAKGGAPDEKLSPRPGLPPKPGAALR
jgi:glucosamine kinase